MIVEAAEKSGSLITARMALEQDRQVFAVPGSPLSGKTRGSNRLLREGAVLVECVEDVIEELAPQMAGKASMPAERERRRYRQRRVRRSESESPGSGDAQRSEPLTRARLPSDPSLHSHEFGFVESLVEEKTREIQAILDCLIDAQRLHVDAVIETCQLPPQTVLNLLLELELRGWSCSIPASFHTTLGPAHLPAGRLWG